MNPGASLPHHDNMPLNEPRVEHVTDTALMVAAARAMETVRADGVVRDLFAGRLAGARGEALARKMVSPEWLGIGVGLRCRTVDEMLLVFCPINSWP